MTERTRGESSSTSDSNLARARTSPLRALSISVFSVTAGLAADPEEQRLALALYRPGAFGLSTGL